LGFFSLLWRQQKDVPPSGRSGFDRGATRQMCPMTLGQVNFVVPGLKPRHYVIAVIQVPRFNLEFHAKGIIFSKTSCQS
jgi:hypothetical protein